MWEFTLEPVRQQTVKKVKKSQDIVFQLAV